MTISQSKRAEYLAKARAVFKESGLNSHERAIQKIEESIVWIYRHGYTSPDLLRQMMGVKSRSGMAKKLENMGLAKLSDIEGGGLIKGVPRRLVTLTYAGVAMASPLTSTWLNYPTEPYRAIGRMDRVQHNILVQFITLNAMRRGVFDGYETEREIYTINELSAFNRAEAKRVKIPDAIFTNGNRRTAIELELTPKRGNKFHIFASGLIAGMPTDKEEIKDYEVTRRGVYEIFVKFKKYRWDDVIIITKTEQMKNNYIRELKAGKHVDRWEPLKPDEDSARNNAMRHIRHKITEDEAGRFLVLSLEDIGL